MDRRTFLATGAAAAITPALPLPTARVVGVDLAAGPDLTTVARYLWTKTNGIEVVHKVYGIPRYVKGDDGIERDTWQEQVDAGLSEVRYRSEPEP